VDGRDKTLSKDDPMDETLAKELATQTQAFKALIAEYCRLESVAAQNRMMQETADWVEKLLQKTGFVTRQLPVEGAPNYVYGTLKGKNELNFCSSSDPS
jgi:acetylornithine deacetylase/succinyl-diaminopimelate desuccinylase-like protein